MRQAPFGHGVSAFFFDWTKTVLDSATSLTLLRQLRPAKRDATGTVPPDFLLLASATLHLRQVIGQCFCTGSLAQ